MVTERAKISKILNGSTNYSGRIFSRTQRKNNE